MPDLLKPTLISILGCLACGRGGANRPSPQDRGRLSVVPNPATLSTGASLTFNAVPDVNNEAPYISSTTWTIDEQGGGSVQSLTQVGDQARYTAPQATGTFHVRATSNFGTSWYIPQPATVQVVAPSVVNISITPSQLFFNYGYSGSPSTATAKVAPITNDQVAWSVVEPGVDPRYIGIGTRDPNTVTVLITDTGLDFIKTLPNQALHIKATSVELPTIYAILECRIAP